MTNLKKMREAAGMTQIQLADLSGINVRVLQHYEQGTKTIEKAKLETILKLAIALKCSIGDIIEDPTVKALFVSYSDII
jgi:transcriptional regulator with XRE-family HTH domain